MHKSINSETTTSKEMEDSRLCKTQTGQEREREKSRWYIKKLKKKTRKGVQQKKLIDT